MITLEKRDSSTRSYIRVRKFEVGDKSSSITIDHEFLGRGMPPNFSLNAGASPAALARRPLGAG